MSTAPSGHDDHDPAAAADPGHDAFDGEPTHVLAADEPRTPAWLPVLGLSLFAVGAVWFLASRAPARPPEPPPSAIAAVAAAANVPAPNRNTKPIDPSHPPMAIMPQGQQPGQLVPPGQPGQPGQQDAEGALKKLTPEQIRELQKRIEEMKARQQQQGAAAQPPAPGK
jgi:Kinesin associated protein